MTWEEIQEMIGEETDLILNVDLIWQSDWSGDEVGFDDVLVVGLYGLRDEEVYLYIDMETMIVLDAWTFDDEE